MNSLDNREIRRVTGNISRCAKLPGEWGVKAHPFEAQVEVLVVVAIVVVAVVVVVVVVAKAAGKDRKWMINVVGMALPYPKVVHSHDPFVRSFVRSFVRRFQKRILPLREKRMHEGILGIIHEGKFLFLGVAHLASASISPS
ncbi:hypothetical protein V1478_014289 [Vespula squamosa]|uniref:Uncharacterized protein n=1 Tax=Vespula squamosa TaxID=30214 RepID=A0ABD2A7K7_VESSQ